MKLTLTMKDGEVFEWADMTADQVDFPGCYKSLVRQKFVKFGPGLIVASDAVAHLVLGKDDDDETTLPVAEDEASEQGEGQA